MSNMTDTFSGARITNQTQLLDAINSQRHFPIDEKLYELVTGESPYLNLLRKISKIPVGDHENSFVEHRAPWLNTQKGYWFTGGTNFVASDIGDTLSVLLSTVTNVGAALTDFPTFRAGDIVQVVDADDYTKTCNILLKSVVAGSYVKTWTGYCLTQTPGFAPAVDDKVYIVGSAFGENGAFTTGEYTKPQTRWFSCQIFKDQVSFSRRIEHNTRIIYGSESDRMIKEGLGSHYVKMDRALLHGSSRQTAISSQSDHITNPFSAAYDEMVDADGNPISTSASFKQIMDATTNRDVSLTTQLMSMTMAEATYDDLVDIFERIFKYGNKTKECICGSGVVSFYNKMAMKYGDYTLSEGENAYGIEVTVLKTPHGKLNLQTSPGMSEAGYNYAMAIIDPDNIALAEFDATTWYGLPKTKDGKDIEILTDCGLWVRKPETHAWVWHV